VIGGNGRTETALGAIPWNQGDFVALPGLEAEHFAEDDSAFYMVNDSPLFAYLGAQRSHARFSRRSTPATWSSLSLLTLSGILKLTSEAGSVSF
jgi:hypothetical protein